jgi:hypothetical protein
VGSDFIGAQGKVVKQCMSYCRVKDAKRKARPDVKKKTAERNKKMNYSKTHRNKKRADDEEAYLANEAEKMRKWRANNKEHLSLYCTTNVNRRFSAIKDQASKKGYVWELDDEEAKRMMTSGCVYCGYLDLETTVNGIDRMDNATGYTPDNCVPCCGVCNFMKLSLDANTFVERCRHISFVHGGPGEITDKWQDHMSASYNKYKTRATKKQLEFALSMDEFDSLCASDCEYCARSSIGTNRNGVDRVDNAIGYVDGNCVACCTECNHTKRDLSYDVLIAQCVAVASKEHDFPNMPRCLNVITKRTD